LNDLQEEIKLITDWSIYKEILFHLVQNGIKFSNENTKIRVELLFVYNQTDFEALKDSPLQNYLETKIINFGPKFELMRKKKHFKTFAFN